VSAVGARVDDIDVQVEKIQRLIEHAGRFDPELAAGLATGQTLQGVERELNQASAVCEDLEHHLRDVVRNRERGGQ
jgi:hypothetical protein